MRAFQITEFSNDTRYASAVARVRALETQLLSKQKLYRMAEKPDWQGVLDELRATDYSEPLSAARSAIDIERALLQVLKQRYRTIHELAIEPALTRAIISWHDFDNLKILLKQKWSDSSRQLPLSDLGLIDPEALKNALNNQDSLPHPLKDVYGKILQDYEENRSLFRAEMLIDCWYLNYIRETFEGCNIPFLKFFIHYRIDLIKIQMMLRWRGWNEEAQFPRELFPIGGFLADDRLSALGSNGWDKISPLLQFSPYANLVSDTSEKIQSGSDLWLLERRSDDFLTEFCKLSHYTAFGVEPLFAFLWVSLQEFRNVQLIVTTKKTGVSPENIKPRLREAYA